MSLSPPGRLLVRGVNWLGDAVMTTPALLRLREALPDTHITLLTRAKLAELWRSHPALNEVLTIEPGESVWSVGGKVRAGDYDAALVFPNSPRSAIEVFLARISRRIGYARPWRNWFLTDIIPSRPGHVKMRKRAGAEIKRLTRGAGSSRGGKRWPAEAHQMHEYLHLVATLGGDPQPLPPLLQVDKREVNEATRRFKTPADRPIVGLNVGAEYGPAKRWPLGNFIKAAKQIGARANCALVIFGGPRDTDLAADLEKPLQPTSVEVRNVAGQTSLRELMALLSQCRVLLTNDTGPMHIAAALGTPVVVPFGSTSPELTGPGLPDDPAHRLILSDAPCAPCFLRECPIDFRCMGGISVVEVADAVVRVLRRGGC